MDQNQQKAQRCKRRSEAGFTLIEIMIVLAIVGLLFSFVGVNVLKKYRSAKKDAAKIQMAAIAQALDAFFMDNDFYPNTQQGLEALISKPGGGRSPRNYDPDGYFKKKQMPKDPFGLPYQYKCDDYQNYELSSSGPDGQSGTEDDVLFDG